MATGTQTDPIQHTHLCPVCYAQPECKDFCATEFSEDGSLAGNPITCDACKKAPSEGVDIFVGQVAIGDVLRCGADSLVYEVTGIDPEVRLAALETVVGYPYGRRTMNLAMDGSPARYYLVDGSREPLWFRVKG